MLCDLCSRQVAEEKTFRLPLRELRRAVDAGFDPFRAADMTIWKAMPFNVGLSDEDLFREWRRRMVQAKRDWQICPLCAEAFQGATGRVLVPIGQAVGREGKPRMTLGEFGRRHRPTLYFVFAITVLLGIGVEVCRRFDWSRLHRAEWEKRLAIIEKQVLKVVPQADQRVYRLAADVGRFLRDRWMVGYLYDQTKGTEYFIGRPSPADFRRAIEAQKAAIAAGKPFDSGKIPKYRFDMEFKELRCRLVVGAAEPPGADLAPK